jgi:hypothetical protein
MARSQNSARGIFAKDVLRLTLLAAIPTTRVEPGAIRAVSNSTGVCLVINTTGTTWKYIQKTSVQPS